MGLFRIVYYVDKVHKKKSWHLLALMSFQTHITLTQKHLLGSMTVSVTIHFHCICFLHTIKNGNWVYKNVQLIFQTICIIIIIYYFSLHVCISLHVIV